jgi:hypothetical protein
MSNVQLGKSWSSFIAWMNRLWDSEPVSAAEKAAWDEAHSRTPYVHPETHSADIVVDGVNNRAFTAAEKTKLGTIAESANNYVHPATHSADIITDGDTNKAYTAAEKSKLAAIEAGATNNPKAVQVTGVVLAAANWALVAGLYEYNVASALIDADSIVDVIPENASIAVVRAADILPKTLSSAGAVKLYATYLPTNAISVTLSITKKQ